MVEHLRYAIIPDKRDLLAKEKNDPIWEFKEKHVEIVVISFFK